MKSKNLCCEKTEKLGSEGQLVENVVNMLIMQCVTRLILDSLQQSTDQSQDWIVRRLDFGCAAIFWTFGRKCIPRTNWLVKTPLFLALLRGTLVFANLHWPRDHVEFVYERLYFACVLLHEEQYLSIQSYLKKRRYCCLQKTWTNLYRLGLIKDMARESTFCFGFHCFVPTNTTLVVFVDEVYE